MHIALVLKPHGGIQIFIACEESVPVDALFAFTDIEARNYHVFTNVAGYFDENERANAWTNCYGAPCK